MTILLNLLLGFLVGFLIGKLQYNIKYKAPDSSKIRKEIFKEDGICYRLVPQAVVGGIFREAHNTFSKKV